jgi:ribonuclease P protein component
MKKTLSNIEVNRLFKKGKWITTTNISAIYVESNVFRYTVSAPLKHFKKATDRNKVKRLLRQGIQNNEHKNINIVFIYRNNIILDSKEMENEIKKIFNKIK